jgi:hypothetical protein
MKETTVDQITVAEDGSVLYRAATVVIENGIQIAKTYHRTSLTPGQDLANQPKEVVAACNATWTPEVVQAYQAKVAALEAQ